MDLQLTDRVFVVTAASSGLGRATATQLVAEGAKVVLVARRGDVLDEAVAELGSDSAVALTADLTAVETPAQAARLAVATYGRLDGALISVGGPPAGPALAMSDDQWRDGFESVFLAALRTIGAVVDHGTADDLAIACVLSTSALSPIGGLSISNGLRPGLAMLIKQVADEHGPDGTRINGLLPGRISTERVQYLDSLADDPEAARRGSAARIPLRRYGDPDEFGKVATFLLSPAASYVSGSLLAVDGGALRAL
ncbi:SDR family oxidoreductase [Microlunatus soli]|uniref:3-oxoacyl-[acyl-carrier protein] reductase n=1 Tax=Microlunatus soli TaxID=630515 RepID=A0A1H1P2G1_9ACTN|nr:SDR family oxidoreductase [Microlunatus soli]SDS05205.1 3-oxoacyl-[acyl-carrier protein] reductase [Microlunatus soli]